MLTGLGPSLRWDDEFLRFRAVLIYKLMVEKWNQYGATAFTASISSTVGKREKE